MIELDFFDSSSKYGVIKATVHRTGKLGFSSGAAKFMKLDQIEYFNIGYNKADDEDNSLYFVPLENENDKAFKVVKAGDYYYVFIKNILKEKKIDYKVESIIYEIDEIEVSGKKIFKLYKRENK